MIGEGFANDAQGPHVEGVAGLRNRIIEEPSRGEAFDEDLAGFAMVGVVDSREVISDPRAKLRSKGAMALVEERPLEKIVGHQFPSKRGFSLATNAR
jgi:hypothetical protein